MSNRNKEIMKIRRGIEKHGRKAFKVTLENGVTATILKGNQICRISPDGSVAVVKKISKSKFKVFKSVFILK